MRESRGISIAISAVIVASVLMFGQCILEAQTPKVNQLTLREQIKSLKEEQRQEVNRIEGDLWKSNIYAAELYVALKYAQEQVNKVGGERDGWKAYGDDRNEKWLNAELRVAKKQATILKLGITIGTMTLAIGAYLVAKFYFRLPI